MNFLYNTYLILGINVRYLDGALGPESDSMLGTPEAPTGRLRDYIPAADPGCRLPHMNVRVLSSSSSKVCWFSVFLLSTILVFLLSTILVTVL